METIAEAHMSLPDREEGIATIFSLFPAANSLSDSSDSSLSNRTLQHHLSPYSITSFFPPNNPVSSSVSTQTIHFPPSISSLFPPTQSVDSQLNSLCSERSNPGFGNSITSIFPPNYSYSSSIESTQYHDQFGSNKSKLSHEFKDVVTGRTEPHFQEPNINRWRSFKFHISNEERIFQKQVEAELRQAQEKWTYAIYWELDRPSRSPLWGTFSQVKGFYNVNDYKFNDKAMALSFFQFMDSWFSTFGSVLNQVFSTSSPIWVVEEDCLKTSKYYQSREGHHYGLQTMSWIRVADGVMEFGSTELIYPS